MNREELIKMAEECVFIAKKGWRAGIGDDNHSDGDRISIAIIAATLLKDRFENESRYKTNTN